MAKPKVEIPLKVHKAITTSCKMMNALEALEDEYKQKKKAIERDMAVIDAYIRKAAENLGVEKIESDYMNVTPDVEIYPKTNENWEDFCRWLSEDISRFSMIRKDCIKIKEFKKYVEDTGEPPPGLSCVLESKLNKRRKQGASI